MKRCESARMKDAGMIWLFMKFGHVAGWVGTVNTPQEAGLAIAGIGDVAARRCGKMAIVSGGWQKQADGGWTWHDRLFYTRTCRVGAGRDAKRRHALQRR